MRYRWVLGLAAAGIAGAAGAVTPIGAATLIDDAVVHAGTVVPGTFLAYAGGGRDDITGTGTANGTDHTYTGGSLADRAAAAATADHLWIGFDPAIGFSSPVPLTQVLAIPAIDHGWTPGNTEPTEAHEAFEFIVWGCDFGAVPPGCLEPGRITEVFVRGVDDSGPARNADDWSTVWTFTRPYSLFAVTGGDRLLGGPYSIVDGMLEGEIDALAAVPEPAAAWLMLPGLTGLALLARRRRGGR